MLSRSAITDRLSSVLRGVTLEVDFSTFRNETLAAFLTTAFDEVTSCFRGHAGTEAVLLFTRAFGRLVCAEAHGECLLKVWCREWRGGGTLGITEELSMQQCVIFLKKYVLWAGVGLDCFLFRNGSSSKYNRSGLRL